MNPAPVSFPVVGSLSAFWPFVEPLLRIIAPRRVCEIGVDNGFFSRQLLDYCARKECAYFGIDPEPSDAARQCVDEFGNAGCLLKGYSLEVLPELELCDIYFVDGDHNYYTVLHELRAISARAAQDERPFPVVFLHDAGWPWARRDMYYAPSRVPEQFRQPSSDSLGVDLNQDELIDGGLREVGRYSIALKAGGAKNGVLTAIEDFVAESATAGRVWEMAVVPAAFGLAILYLPESLPQAALGAVRDLRSMDSRAAGFLRILDDNFLKLYLSFLNTNRSLQGLDKCYNELATQYDLLRGHCASLGREYDSLLDHCRKLQVSYDHLAQSR